MIEERFHPAWVVPNPVHTERATPAYACNAFWSIRGTGTFSMHGQRLFGFSHLQRDFVISKAALDWLYQEP